MTCVDWRSIRRGNPDELATVRRFDKRSRPRNWRRHYPLFGKPDFVFPKLKLAIFVDGCFWHCCPRHSNLPVNNRQFWERKLEGNRRRDRLVSRGLAAGWRVIRVWEHELSRKNQTRLLGRMRRALNAGGRITSDLSNSLEKVPLNRSKSVTNRVFDAESRVRRRDRSCGKWAIGQGGSPSNGGVRAN